MTDFPIKRGNVNPGADIGERQQEDTKGEETEGLQRCISKSVSRITSHH
jgi:hypothetical protein